MAKIFYGVCGEGRGHSTRVRAVVEALREENEVVIYASGQAHELLTQVYQGADVHVRHIAGLGFHYTADHRLDYGLTGWKGLWNLLRFPRVIRRIQKDMEAEEPDLVITDFEPILARAARRCGVPFISLNHQHFLETYDLGSLPPSLRYSAAFMAQVVRAYYSGQVHTIVSSFFFPPLKAGCENVTQVGVLLRPEVIHAACECGSHLVAYWRRFACPSVWEALTGCGCEVRVYGLGSHSRRGPLRFFDVDVYRFVEDLATSRGLISTAGNQLVGEALYLGKPVLAMPEPGNHEQAINAHFLQESGAGMTLNMERLASPDIRRFLDDSDRLRSRIDRIRLYGNPRALEIINRYLRKPSTVPIRIVPRTAPKEAMA